MNPPRAHRTAPHALNSQSSKLNPAPRLQRVQISTPHRDCHERKSIGSGLPPKCASSQLRTTRPHLPVDTRNGGYAAVPAVDPALTAAAVTPALTAAAEMCTVVGALRE